MSKQKNTVSVATVRRTIASIVHWEELEVRTTKDVAKQLGIPTPAAYQLLATAEQDGLVTKYGYRVKGGWEDVRNSGHQTNSLGWQKNSKELVKEWRDRKAQGIPAEVHCPDCDAVLASAKRDHDTTIIGVCWRCRGKWVTARENEPDELRAPVSIVAVDARGRLPVYKAKVGTMPGSLIVVRRDRTFWVGQCIKFAETHALRGQSIGVTPAWRNGSVWKIEDDRLYLNLE